MKQNQIEDLPRLQIENLENIFNVYKDDNGLYYYNLLNSIVFPQNLPLSLFARYVWAEQDTWPLVSYKNYGSPNLWWIITMANNIINPLKGVSIGSIILIPTTTVVKQILSQISK